MIISAIRWENFKSFYGKTSLEGLETGLSRERNVVLFGGVNGAGKTTILESVFLCLYGQGASNLYPTRGAKGENYQAYISSLLNNKVKAVNDPAAKMSVEILLKDVPIFSNIGRDISIRRIWHFEAGTNFTKFQENPEILENGKPIEEVSESEYGDLIRSLLPYEVSQFFFFDGEKIQDFASDSDVEFAKSLKDVLGINLYGTLVDDLKTVKQRMFKEFSESEDAQNRYEEKQAEERRLQKEIESWQLAISSLRDEIEEKQLEVERLEHETHRITRIKADSRESFLVEKDRLQQEKEMLEKTYFDLTKDNLPFLLSSALFDDLLQQVESERKAEQIRAAQAEVEPKIQSIIDEVFDNNPPPTFSLNGGIRRYFEMKIDAALRGLFGAEQDSQDGVTVIHNFRPEQAEKVRMFFTGLQSSTEVGQLNTITDRLKEIEVDLQRISQTNIRSGGNSEETLKLFDRIKHLSEEIGIQKGQVQDYQNRIEVNKKAIEVARREATNWEKKAAANNRYRAQIEYCDRLQSAIKDYQKRLQASKTEELQRQILWMWIQLTHKPELIQRVQILPEKNFEVKLFGADGNEIDKTKLSAGEKEIYAISLLSALVAVSGKNVPIIIDTPFGRLDSIHRRNLATKYFPAASHQVLILSQDEEIVEEYYTLLKPHVAREIAVENVEGETVFRDGYPFANGKQQRKILQN